jgi:hypothetical protein
VSYSLVPYLIDLVDLQGYFVKTADGNWKSWPAEIEQEDQLQLDRLRKEGSEISGTDSYEYGYALRRLCEAIGQTFDIPELVERHDMDLFQDIPWMRSGAPVALPLYDNFPYIGHLSGSEVANAVREAEELLENDAGPHSSIFEGLLTLYDKAAATCRDVIAFYY